MGLPLLLLVDDSAVVLSYETSVLGPHYALATAVNGRAGLEKAAALRPAVILLDLSMPVMTGDEMLERLMAHPELKSIPVIIVSSEQERGEAARGRGAAAFLKKPIKADELRSTVARVLEEAVCRRLEGGMRVIMIEAGPAEVGIDLDDVQIVSMLPSITPLALGPSYLVGITNVGGEPVCVLDLAFRLGVDHSVPLLDRKLVVLNRGEVRLALCIDRVHDPIELTSDQVVPREQFAGAPHDQLRATIMAVVQTARGHRLVIDPVALLSRPLARRLANILRGSQLQFAATVGGAGP